MSSKIATGARILLGLLFFVFGLNGFLNFIPQPPPPEKLAAFMTGMMSSVYFFPLLKGTEVVVGLMLLANKKVALALIILAPIALNIFMVHAFLAPEGLPMAIAIVILGLIVAREHRETYAPLFK